MIFTARRYASAVFAVIVCLSVSVSCLCCHPTNSVIAVKKSESSDHNQPHIFFNRPDGRCVAVFMPAVQLQYQTS